MADIEVICSAPDCKRLVKVDSTKLFFMKMGSFFRGGDFEAAVFCPEHNERITGGRESDGDPNTNPDLIPEQEKLKKK
jgi:hypothetical protein